MQKHNCHVLVLAMRIHISETTQGELMKAGIYHMEKRGEVMAKVQLYQQSVLFSREIASKSFSPTCPVLNERTRQRYIIGNERAKSLWISLR